MASSRACRLPQAACNTIITAVQGAESRSYSTTSFLRIRTSRRTRLSNPPAQQKCLQYCTTSLKSLGSISSQPHQRVATSVSSHSAGRRLLSASTSEAPNTTLARPEAPDFLDEKEKAIFDRLSDALEPTALEVQDISGGCGSMYAVSITTERFQGLPVIKQHRLVNEVLGEDIKSWHGIQLRTKAP